MLLNDDQLKSLTVQQLGATSAALLAAALPTYTTAARPDAASVPPGYTIFNTTEGYVNVSTGSAWVSSAPVAPAAIPTGSVNLPNGYGSTNTLIVTWTNTTDGVDVTWTKSATLGTYATIARAGQYLLSGSVKRAGAGFCNYALCAAAALSNTYDAAHIVAAVLTSGGGDGRSLAGTRTLAVGDVVWAMSSTADALSGGATQSLFGVDYLGPT